MPRLVHTVLDYEDRGPWGDSSYHGNTSGYIVRDLIETFESTRVLDPMEGSGTSRQVAAEMGVEYFGYDLNNGDDMLHPATQKKIITEMGGWNRADLIFWHPPYWNMVMYHPTDPRDFSSGPYITYLTKMQQGLRFLAQCLAHPDNITGRAFQGGFPRIAILIGDLKYKGRFYWIARDLTSDNKLHRAGLQLENVMIRRQRGVSSNAMTYNPRDPLIRIMHETILVLEPLGN